MQFDKIDSQRSRHATAQKEHKKRRKTKQDRREDFKGINSRSNATGGAPDLDQLSGEGGDTSCGRMALVGEVVAYDELKAMGIVA